MNPYFEDSHVKLYLGDCRQMAEVPDNSVHCVVTSPPYWSLRKYSGEQELTWGDWHGALGLEPGIEMYISHLVEVFQEVLRLLRPDGCCFVNIGDSMAGSGQGYGDTKTTNKNYHGSRQREKPNQDYGNGLKPLDVCLIPQRLALALQKSGWYVRSWIAWVKPNPMPESVAAWRWQRHRVKMKSCEGNVRGKDSTKPTSGISSDNGHERTEWQDCPGCPQCSPNDGLVLRKGNWRPTDSWETILMLAKSNSYYCDQEAVRESQSPLTLKVHKNGKRYPSQSINKKRLNNGDVSRISGYHTYELPAGRNMRNVWTFPSEPAFSFGGLDHFASFPEKLPKLCIKASTPEVGVCAQCGSPWARVVEKSFVGSYHSHSADNIEYGARQHDGGPASDYEVGRSLGWRATCKCNLPMESNVGATVLDPFMGTGTTVWVAKTLDRRAIGYDLSENYLKLALERNRQGVIL